MILVTVKNSKTGNQYICKSASKTVKDISYHFICIHRNHPFFKQLYHGPKGIYIGSERYKEIETLEKPIWNTPMHELIIPGNCPTFDKATANYVRKGLELYLKLWVLPKLDEVLNELSK